MYGTITLWACASCGPPDSRWFGICHVMHNYYEPVLLLLGASLVVLGSFSGPQATFTAPHVSRATRCVSLSKMAFEHCLGIHCNGNYHRVHYRVRSSSLALWKWNPQTPHLPRSIDGWLCTARSKSPYYPLIYCGRITQFLNRGSLAGK